MAVDFNNVLKQRILQPGGLFFGNLSYLLLVVVVLFYEFLNGFRKTGSIVEHCTGSAHQFLHSVHQSLGFHPGNGLNTADTGSDC